MQPNSGQRNKAPVYNEGEYSFRRLTTGMEPDNAPADPFSSRNNMRENVGNSFNGALPIPVPGSTPMKPPDRTPPEMEESLGKKSDGFWMRRRFTRDESFPELLDFLTIGPPARDAQEEAGSTLPKKSFVAASPELPVGNTKQQNKSGNYNPTSSERRLKQQEKNLPDVSTSDPNLRDRSMKDKSKIRMDSTKKSRGKPGDSNNTLTAPPGIVVTDILRGSRTKDVQRFDGDGNPELMKSHNPSFGEKDKHKKKVKRRKPKKAVNGQDEIVAEEFSVNALPGADLPNKDTIMQRTFQMFNTDVPDAKQDETPQQKTQHPTTNLNRKKKKKAAENKAVFGNQSQGLPHTSGVEKHIVPDFMQYENSGPPPPNNKHQHSKKHK